MTETEWQKYDNGPDTIMGVKDSTIDSDQGETEDEEVKRNCIMGQSGIHDSDFSDSENEDDDQDDGEEESEEEEQGEPVKFVTTCGQIPNPRGRIYKPTPLMPKLATHPEENEEGDSTDDTEERYVSRLTGLLYIIVLITQMKTNALLCFYSTTTVSQSMLEEWH
jgi:hypothetical protein